MGYTPLLGTVIADFVGSEDYYCYTFNSKTKSFDYLYDDDDLDAPKIARVQFSFTPILYKHELSYLMIVILYYCLMVYYVLVSCVV